MRQRRLHVGPCTLALLAAVLPAASGRGTPADVLDAKGRCDAAASCSLSVTVRHADEGWSHFADRWDVVGPDGAVLATRVLRHPHVEEQPFTRALDGIVVPPDVQTLRIRARCSVDGYGGAELTVPAPR